MKALALKAIALAFVLAMFYLMLVADSVVARFFALTVYSIGLTLIVGGYTAVKAREMGVAEGRKTALDLQKGSGKDKQ